MKKNLFKLSTWAILLLFTFVACDKNDDVLNGVETGKVAVQFKATNAPILKSVSEGETRSLIFDEILEITSFKVNITEIEFDFDDDDDMAIEFNGSFSSDDDFKLRGPFEVDLISNGQLQTQTLLKGLNIPKGKYEEIEFDLEKSKNKSSALYNKTVLIKGKIMGKEFVFSSNKEFDFEVEFDKPFVPGDNAGVVVNFHINSFFTSMLKKYNFKQEFKVNSDGVIVITYNEDDDKTNYYDLGKKIWELMDDMFDCDDFDDNFDD